MPRQGDDTPAGATSSSGVRDHLWDEVYIGLEAGATSIRNFEPSVVPGLLQTEDCARETFRNGPIELDLDGVERLVEVRLARQEILTRDGSFSSQSGNCVEVARNLPGLVLVRDSEAPEGPKLLVSPRPGKHSS